MRALGFAPKKEEISKMLTDLDNDGNGSVEYDEFEGLMAGKMVCAVAPFPRRRRSVAPITL